MPLIWSKLWRLPKLITAFLLCLWLEAGINTVTELSCISNSLFCWWWMILPLSQDNTKSLKFTPHPVFFSLNNAVFCGLCHHQPLQPHTQLRQKPSLLTLPLLHSHFLLRLTHKCSHYLEYIFGAYKSRFFCSVLPTTGSSLPLFFLDYFSITLKLWTVFLEGVWAWDSAWQWITGEKRKINPNTEVHHKLSSM